MLSIYIAWPISGVTWVLFLAERFWDLFADYNKERSLGSR
jgi:hypothetical protein